MEDIQKTVDNISGSGEMMKQSDFDPWRCVAAAAGAGLTLACSIGVGVFLGVLFDGHFETSPWGLLTLSFLGAAAGLWSIAKQMIGK